MLVSTLKATKKITDRDNIRSNLHTGQYAGSGSPDHSWGEVLVKPLVTPWGSRYINKFLCKTTQKRGNRLAMHTSGLDIHQWSQLPLVESGKCFGGHGIVGILHPQLL